MKKLMILSGLVAAMSAASMAQAAEGTLNFTGELTAASCQVNATVPGNIAVDMGQVDFSSLSTTTIGMVETPIQFEVNCTDAGGLDMARLTFDASRGSDTNPNNRQLLALDNTSTGSGVGIALVGPAGIIDLSSATPTITTNLDAGSANFDLKAGFVLDGTAPTAGAVSATLPFVLSLE